MEGVEARMPGAEWLSAVGACIRRAREAQGVAVIAAAKAAGLSRVTWHRIERGEPSVAIGSYARAIDALGPQALVTGARDEAPAVPTAGKAWIPTRIRVADYPQLRAAAWHVREDTELSPREALDIYERQGRHIDEDAMTDEERALLHGLRGVLEHGDVHA